MSHKSDSEHLAARHNVSRYSVETPAVVWVLLVATIVLGTAGYLAMPKRKDPYIKVRAAVAVCAWPGTSAEKVEEQLTRKIEEKIAQNADVAKIESTSRTGVSIVTVTLRDEVPYSEIAKAFDDIDLKLRTIPDLPQGAQPIDFQKDFGDTAALMLTVASPKVSDLELNLRARALQKALESARGASGTTRSAVVLAFPAALNPMPLRRVMDLFAGFAARAGVRDPKILEGAGFVALDGEIEGGEARWQTLIRAFLEEVIHASSFHPDVWSPVVITDPSTSLARLRTVRGDRYSYR